MIDNVSVLFCSKDSIYKGLVSDCWDIDRDARKYHGSNPVIVHPPCRSWGKLAHLCNFDIDEHNLAHDAIKFVRTYGGVLEHPRASRLWPRYLPLPGQYDAFGGFSLSVDQFWWGHKALKASMLYVCGCSVNDVPQMPLNFNAREFVVSTSYRRHSKQLKSISKRERLATPELFAKWLIELASKCSCNNRFNSL